MPEKALGLEAVTVLVLLPEVASSFSFIVTTAALLKTVSTNSVPSAQVNVINGLVLEAIVTIFVSAVVVETGTENVAL